jgi:hypothetical protein
MPSGLRVADAAGFRARPCALVMVRTRPRGFEVTFQVEAAPRIPDLVVARSPADTAGGCVTVRALDLEHRVLLPLVRTSWLVALE